MGVPIRQNGLKKWGVCMKKMVMLVASLLIVTSAIYADVMVENKLNLLELDAQKTMQGFNDLSKNMSIATISESIVSHNAHMLETALQDLISLNKSVHSQVNIAVQFWNMYLDKTVPTMETYLLGQVINSLIGTIRALSLRSSTDQAMILSLIKSTFKNDAQGQQEVAIAVEAKAATVEDRWKSMRIQ